MNGDQMNRATAVSTQEMQQFAMIAQRIKNKAYKLIDCQLNYRNNLGSMVVRNYHSQDNKNKYNRICKMERINNNLLPNDTIFFNRKYSFKYRLNMPYDYQIAVCRLFKYHLMTQPVPPSSELQSNVILNPQIWHYLENQQNNCQELMQQIVELSQKLLSKQEQLYLLQREDIKAKAELDTMTESTKNIQHTLKKMGEVRKLRICLEQGLGLNKKEKQSRTRRQ